MNLDGEIETSGADIVLEQAESIKPMNLDGEIETTTMRLR